MAGFPELPENEFKNPRGVYLTRGLFYETTLADKATVKFTLKNQDHAGYPSLYRLYMETDDPTEYTFATTHLDSWEHWERLCESTWFKPYIQAWRRELEIRTRARALRAIKETALGNDRDAYQANKYLLDGAWKEKSTRGRPSNQEVKQEIIRQADETRSVNEHFDRLLGSIPNSDSKPLN